MVIFGMIAAAVTFGIGHLLGTVLVVNIAAMKKPLIIKGSFLPDDQ